MLRLFAKPVSQLCKYSVGSPSLSSRKSVKTYLVLRNSNSSLIDNIVIRLCPCMLKKRLNLQFEPWRSRFEFLVGLVNIFRHKAYVMLAFISKAGWFVRNESV